MKLRGRLMPLPLDREIRSELQSNYGYLINSRRLWNIRIAHILRLVGTTKAAGRLRGWRDRLMAVLKIEDQVLKSYDRMAGVYNKVNQTLREDTTLVFCKHDARYERHEAREIYRKQLAYVSDSVFRPLLRDGMTVLEVGAGETTTIHNLINSLAPLKVRWSGLELSWSRIAEGKRWALEHGTLDQFDHLVAASAVDIPFSDGSFDVVFTNGCVEQIRYNTERALSEILRVARRLVVLYEPTYELGDKHQRLYLEGSQYCRGIPDILKSLGARIVRHELAPHSFNPFCCYAVTIVEKIPMQESSVPLLCCPKCKKPLTPIAEGYYCDSFDCSCVYPALWNIPCLREADGIFASKYREMLGSPPQNSD
jgi:ubiquinone/menaquinone biosynthesis C-methylase UbiE